MNGYDKNILLANIDNIHTTKLGIDRVRKNLSLDNVDVVKWCKDKIKSYNAVIEKKGMNWYIDIEDSIITVNAYSYTIITAHKKNKKAFDK